MSTGYLDRIYIPPMPVCSEMDNFDHLTSSPALAPILVGHWIASQEACGSPAPRALWR